MAPTYEVAFNFHPISTSYDSAIQMSPGALPHFGRELPSEWSESESPGHEKTGRAASSTTRFLAFEPAGLGL